MSKKILIAEDIADLSDMMKQYLMRAGYAVLQAFNGKEAVAAARKHNPDLLLLDIMMPEMDGYQVCANLRLDMQLPIIIVTSKEGEADKLRMFDLGADDYITKPFSFAEMVGRVKAQLRRYYEFERPSAGERRLGALTIFPERFEAVADGQKISLTAKEFKLLEFFTRNRNQIFNKQKLMDEIWGYDEYVDESAVTMAVSRLREKLTAHGVKNIETVWGFGYKWQDYDER